VTNIGVEAFQSCTSLTNVFIGSGLTNIGDTAFEGCSNLASVFFGGNAPTAGQSVFADDGEVVVYYLPGTTGWSSSWPSEVPLIPTVMWNPLIQANGASFGVKDNRFGFNITGTTNIPIVVEASANLAAPVWTPLQSFLLTNGLAYFSDAQWTNYPARYYRISAP
jgi:hypothetical protein